jgi:hypothetical protein
MPDQPSNTPKPLRVLIALQSLTLVAVLAGQPAVPTAGADFGRADRVVIPTLPNAAAQRQEMIRLLKVMVENDQAAAKKLDSQMEVLNREVIGLGERIGGIEQRLPEPEAP